MIEDEPDVCVKIRSTFERVVAQGLRPTAYRGASDDQIDQMARSQDVPVVPISVRQVLRLVGGGPGLWLAGSSFGAGAVGPEDKQAALAQLSRSGNPLRDAHGLLVLVAHQGHSYQVIDGADLTQPNPAVWLVAEGEQVNRRWSSVTEWFESISPDVERYRERLTVLLETDPDFLPGWATHIDPGHAGT